MRCQQKLRGHLVSCVAIEERIPASPIDLSVERSKLDTLAESLRLIECSRGAGPLSLLIVKPGSPHQRRKRKPYGRRPR